MTERERLLIEVRKRSLDVLGMLKELEERHRKDDSLDSTTARSKTTLSDTALVSQADEEKDTAEIAVYDETVMLETLTKESELVEEWVDTVKSLLELSGDMKARRGRRSEGSLGDEGFSEGQAESGDQKLPSWAEQDGFESSLGVSLVQFSSYASIDIDILFESLIQIERFRSFKLISLPPPPRNFLPSPSLSAPFPLPASTSFRFSQPALSSVNPTTWSSHLRRVHSDSSQLRQSTSSLRVKQDQREWRGVGRVRVMVERRSGIRLGGFRIYKAGLRESISYPVSLISQRRVCTLFPLAFSSKIELR